MQIGWHMRLSARPPSSYARTTVLVLVLLMISGTSIQAAPTTSLPVPAPISTTSTTTAPGLTTSITVMAPKPTTSTTTTSTTTTSMTTSSVTTTTSTTTTSATAAAAPPETIMSTTTALKPTTTTTTAPPETITTTDAVPPPTTTNAAPPATTPTAAPPPATTNAAPPPATTNTPPPRATPNAATTTAPSLESTPEMAVSTSTVPPKPTASNNDFSLLWKCSRLGSDQCSFSTKSNVGLQSYNLFVGSPLSNCHNGTAAIDSEISGSISTSDTWSPGLTVGLQFGPLNLQTSDGWSRSTTRMYSQSVTIHVPPAQQGALIAIVTYNVSSGHMKIGSTDVYPVFSNQPTGNVEYDAAVIGCDDTFNANYSAPFPSSGSPQRPISSLTLFMSAILIGMTYML